MVDVIKEELIPLEQITEENEKLLLRGSKLGSKGKQGEDANALLLNIKARHFQHGIGLINRITVAPVWNHATGEPVPNAYFLVDGKQRKSIYEALDKQFPGQGFDKIPAQINYSIKSPQDIMIAQWSSNESRVPTSRPEQAKMVLNLIQGTGGIEEHSVDRVAEIFGRSLEWVYGMVKLQNLIPEAADAFAEGDLRVTHAQKIAQLPQDQQLNFLNQNLETSDDEERAIWLTKINQHLKNLKDDPSAVPPDKVFRVRKGADISERLFNPHPDDESKTWTQALEWVGRLDEESKLEAQAKKDNAKLAREQAKLEKTRKEQEEREAELAELESKIKEREAKLQSVSD